jgi:hypothetical protein
VRRSILESKAKSINFAQQELQSFLSAEEELSTIMKKGG